MVEERTVSKDGFGSMIDFEPHKLNRVVLSITVSQILFMYKMFWDLSVYLWLVDGYERRVCGYSHAD